MSSHLQEQLFQHLKNRLPVQASLVDEIALTLDISTDSAYRRIRGEKTLSLEEVHKLCTRFKLSLDNLLNLQTDGFLFSGNFVAADSFQFDVYLANIVQHLKYMCSFKERKMYYLCKDFPIFHHFFFKEIAAFKYYFWMKNILNRPEFVHKKFSLSLYPDELFDLGRQALNYYNQIDSVELWNIESVNSTLRQIEFYHDSNIFAREEEIFMLYDALEKLINHMEYSATKGFKFAPDDEEKKPLAAFQMYFNEILILENSILAVLDTTKAAFLVHNVMNVLITRDPRYCDNTNSYIQNLIKKSTLISTVSERERARFFKHLRQKIAGRKEHLRA